MAQLKNYMEEVVFNVAKKVIKEMNVCDCEKCFLDVSALALNALPAKYIVTPKGELYSKINSLKQQFDVDVVSNVVKAVDLVKKNPRHEYL